MDTYPDLIVAFGLANPNSNQNSIPQSTVPQLEYESQLYSIIEYDASARSHMYAYMMSVMTPQSTLRKKGLDKQQHKPSRLSLSSRDTSPKPAGKTISTKFQDDTAFVRFNIPVQGALPRCRSLKKHEDDDVMVFL